MTKRQIGLVFFCLGILFTLLIVKIALWTDIERKYISQQAPVTVYPPIEPPSFYPSQPISQPPESLPEEQSPPAVSVTQSALNLQIPSTWKKYDNTFQGKKFVFSYPPQITINDSDQESGEIFLQSNPAVGETQLSISRLLYGRSAEPYSSGSRRVWLKQFLETETNTEINQPNPVTFSFKEITFSNGNTFFQVIPIVPEGTQFYSYYFPPNSTTYVGFFQQDPVIIVKQNSMSQDDAFRVMQTLTVTS